MDGWYIERGRSKISELVIVIPKTERLRQKWTMILSSMKYGFRRDSEVKMHDQGKWTRLNQEKDGLFGVLQRTGIRPEPNGQFASKYHPKSSMIVLLVEMVVHFKDRSLWIRLKICIKTQLNPKKDGLFEVLTRTGSLNPALSELIILVQWELGL